MFLLFSVLYCCQIQQRDEDYYNKVLYCILKSGQKSFSFEEKLCSHTNRIWIEICEMVSTSADTHMRDFFAPSSVLYTHWRVHETEMPFFLLFITQTGALFQFCVQKLVNVNIEVGRSPITHGLTVDQLTQNDFDCI